MNSTRLKTKMYVIDPGDHIVRNLASSITADWIDSWKDLHDLPTDQPVIFRSMTQRKTVALCEEQNRTYYYIDTGYIGNMQKRKDWHRLVNSGMQHSQVRYDMPSDRFELISKYKDYLPFPGWKKNGGPILVVTPSEKPCKFYGIDRDNWVEETLSTLKKYTDRKIIVRDKTIRRERVGSGSIYNQLEEENVHALVTYNSIAATEAIGFGIPAFTLAPNAADEFCLKDLSKIEEPYYAEPEKVEKWQHWLGYCQYTPTELSNGTAFKILMEYDLK